MPHKQFSRILVTDIEATCWEPHAQPEDQDNEIIEIGLCQLDVVSLSLTALPRLLIRPEQSTVSPFCTVLTGLTQEQLEREGISFAQACTVLKHLYKTEQYVWASFGRYEQKLFEKQCAGWQTLYPWSSVHLNVQELAAVAFACVQLPSHERVQTLLGLQTQGRPHRAADDAWNTGQVLRSLLVRMRREGES